MTTLSKKDILQKLVQGAVNFSPTLDTYQIQPNSIDLRLGTTFYMPKAWEYNEKGRCALKVDYLDYQNKQESFKIVTLKPGQYFEILANEFVIASTYEKIELKAPDLMAVMYARSSIIRRGLIIESGIIDAQYSGYLMIPIVNNTHSQIIRLYPGERICQLVLHTLSSPLNPEDAKKHGEVSAKYESSTPFGLEARSDSAEEVELIKAGRLDELKEKFTLAKILPYGSSQ